MITHAQILAEINGDLDGANTPLYTPLTAAQQLILENLVKNFDGYRNFVSKWPDLSGTIDAEQATPTDKTYFLKAVLTALDVLPSIKVEAQGTDKEPSFFSTEQNWDELAQDVLNCLYALPVVVGMERFVLVQRTLCDLMLNEPVRFLKQDLIC